MYAIDQHNELIEACLKGDRKAQYSLYQQYSKAMYNICVRMVRDEMEAEDILQHSFVDVFRNLKSFKGQSTIGAWIKRIVVNNCLNFLKKRKLMTTEIDDQHMQITEDTEEHEYPVSVKEIHKAMMDLPEGYRVVLSLYLFEGYDHAEIGEILNISESTSKSQYSRAKRKLKELLTEKNHN